VTGITESAIVVFLHTPAISAEKLENGRKEHLANKEQIVYIGLVLFEH